MFLDIWQCIVDFKTDGRCDSTDSRSQDITSNKINKQDATHRHLTGKQELRAGMDRIQETVCSLVGG